MRTFHLSIFIIFIMLTILTPFFSQARDPGIPVLLYHHLLPNQENLHFRNNNAVIPLEQFVEQMKYLHQHGYQTLTLNQLEQYINGLITVPEKSVVITFDDGYLSNLHYAYPILKKYGFQAVIFAITGSIRPAPESFNPNQLNFISWPEIPRYSDVFDVQGHTHRFHQKKFKFSFLLWKSSSTILDDLAESQRVLPAHYFAYPYGQYSYRTKQLVHQAGYRLGFTIRNQRVFKHSPKMELGRFWIGPQMTMEHFAKIVAK